MVAQESSRRLQGTRRLWSARRIYHQRSPVAGALFRCEERANVLLLACCYHLACWYHEDCAPHCKRKAKRRFADAVINCTNVLPGTGKNAGGLYVA
jgi:hypothetical protein